MADLRTFPTTEVVLQLGSFEITLKPNQKEIKVNNIVLKGRFIPEPKE